MRKLMVILGAGLFSLPAWAADPGAGQQLAGSCQSCHGQQGISNSPLYPNLAGQKSAYLVKQLRDFKTGKRQDPVMSAMVKHLDETAMNQIAEYYSRIRLP